MLSPRSPGKGGRRFPGRDGGKGRRKRITWRSQATHAVDDPLKLSGELVALELVGAWNLPASEYIYRLDQCIAPLGIKYYAEFTGTGRYPRFKITVTAACAEQANAIVSQLEKR